MISENSSMTIVLTIDRVDKSHWRRGQLREPQSPATYWPKASAKEERARTQKKQFGRSANNPTRAAAPPPMHQMQQRAHIQKSSSGITLFADELQKGHNFCLRA
jgi:hypothetical protein